MAEHANAALLRKGYAAFSSGDFNALNEFVPEDAVWHVTGNSATISGDYDGRDAIYAYFGKLMEITGGTFKAELVDVLANDNLGVAIQKSTATVNGKEVVTTDVLIDRVVNGKAVETWVYMEDDTVLG